MQRIILAALLAACSGAAFAGAAGDAARASYQGAGIAFTPAVPYASASIFVAGPDGRTSERRLSTADALYIPSAGLADGTYRYRVVLRPEATAPAPASPAGGPVSAKPAREVSGHFNVSGGSIVDPASRAPQR